MITISFVSSSISDFNDIISLPIYISDDGGNISDPDFIENHTFFKFSISPNIEYPFKAPTEDPSTWYISK